MKEHILVIDDEPQIRELLSLYLAKHDFQVSAASTTSETMDLLAKTSVNLVVLDIGLAEEDGLNLLVQLKAKHPDIQVIMLTGMGFVEDLLQEAYQKGADGYVSKVLPLDELLMTIKRTLGGSRRSAAAASR
jgi:DNA-binding response OmpR family regulator